MIKYLKFLIGVPKRYCEIKAEEMQDAADYFRIYYPEPGSLGYAKGDLAQGIADFWKACAEALPPNKHLQPTAPAADVEGQEQS